MFCKTALLKEAIMMAEDTAGKQARVDELRAAVLKGDAEAEGMDATNPERQRMMEAWCASDDPVRSDPKSDIDCAKSKAKSDFLKRRERLLQFWCIEQGKAGSPKCKQMEFGKKMQQTNSGEERKRQATAFNAARGRGETQADMEAETKQMMVAACEADLGKEGLFTTTCAKLGY